MEGASAYLGAGEFWRKIPAWNGVSANQFNDHLWQERNSVINLKTLAPLVSKLVSQEFLEDVQQGINAGQMAVRLTPYIISLIDWGRPERDPIRKQFLPLASEIETDHPLLVMDPMSEQVDAAAPGLTHRYRDRVLFLATDTCPVYCKYCTRSYAVGTNTKAVSKISFNPRSPRWERSFEYIETHPAIEDVVISGGDCYRLKPEQITLIGERLLQIPHIRRIRFATKGLAVLPMKILTDVAWLKALSRINELGRECYKTVAVHTHFNHKNEITSITEAALNRLFELGIVVRNQSVILSGVNNSAEAIIDLNYRLSYLNVRPYYQFMCDMVQGTENLRTSLQEAIEIEKLVRGTTSGYNTPLFVVDLAGGGGKRDIHSYEIYDRDIGLSIFKAPNVKNDSYFFYCDPLRSIEPYFRNMWLDARKRQYMMSSLLREFKGMASNQRLHYSVLGNLMSNGI